MKGFSKTRIPNLRRNDRSGRYYAFTRAGRGEVGKTLGTTVESIAKLRLTGKLAEIRARAGRTTTGAMTLETCAAIYLDKRTTRRNRALKPRSLDYRVECIKALRRTFPDFAKRGMEKIKVPDCKLWADRLTQTAGTRYSGTRFNGMLQALRGLFAVAIEAQVCDTNPALAIPLAEVRPKIRHTPDQDLFGKILMKLDELPSRAYAAKSIRAYAFTGMRSEEARWVTKSDIDIRRRTLIARKTKNGLERTIPLIRQALELFEDDLEAVLAALQKSPRRALRTVCRELKIKKLTPHDLRSLFSQRMDDAGVSLKSGALVLGHQDGGVTRMRNYLHGSTTTAQVRAQMDRVVI